MNKTPAGWFTTKLIIAVEVTTQFGPQSAIQLVKEALSFPAVKQVITVEGFSNYVPGSVPNTEMLPIDENLLDSIPFQRI